MIVVNNNYMRTSATKILASCLFLAMTIGEAHAHPVSYEGSMMVESFNMEDMTENGAFYSPKYWWSFGLQNFHFQDGIQNQNHFYPRVAILKRWNLTNAQVNFYSWAGAGWSRFGNNDAISALVGSQFDAESRRLYFNSQVQVLLHPNAENTWMTRISGGIAPYLANAGEIQGMMIVQAFHNTAIPGPWVIGPMIRMYYKSILLEVGSGFRGEWMLNLMTTF